VVALADRVCPRCLRRVLEEPQVAVLEHCVEGGGELAAVVADQEPHPLQPLAHGHRQVPCLLRGPGAVWVRGDTAEVDPPGAMLDEHQHLEAFEQHGVHVQEVRGDHGPGLCREELLPTRSVTWRRRIDPRDAQVSQTVDGAKR
jgi:hypothetical protein